MRKAWMVLAVLGVAAVGCEGKEGSGGGGGSKTATPAEICKKHSSGEVSLKTCEKDLTEIQKQLGDAGWKTFADCASKASDETAMGVCMLKIRAMEEDGLTAMSPAAICAKHAKDDAASCTAELETLKTKLGAADWNSFATCAAAANGEEAMGQCILEAGKKAGEL